MFGARRCSARGAVDMKGAIAAFTAAAAGFLEAGPPRGSISLLITGDEEGPATGGTVRVLEWMAGHGHVPDFCLVGEPTNPGQLGEVIKIGRRGSLNAAITVHGTQGHAAYPHFADNPVHRLLRALAALTAAPIDAGTAWFEPSSLQITSVDVGNPATNVIPGSASARLNIRFTDRHSGAALEAWLRAVLAQHAGTVRPVGPGQWRGVPDQARSGCRPVARGRFGGDGKAAAARHGRRHVGCALHRPVLPGGGVRVGRKYHAPGG